MDIEALTRQALEGSMLTEVGREFFKARPTLEQSRKFITALLEHGAYENLATIMSSGCIDNIGAAGYLPDSKQNRRISDRYFSAFTGLMERCEIDMELVWPMFFAAFDAPKSSYLYSFVGGIDAYFKRFAYTDYETALAVMHRFDRRYKCLSTLMEVDRPRTLETVLDILIYGKNANKTTLRKYLLEKRIDIVPALCREYVQSNVKAKEGIVRLLLLYKGDPRADRFLEEIDKSEKSLVIKKLIGKDRNAAKNRLDTESVSKDMGIGCDIDVKGSTYKVTLGRDLTVEVFPVPYPKEVKQAAEKLKKALGKVCAEFETCMSENIRWQSSKFVKRLSDDKMFAAVASTLLFSTYNSTTMSDIVVVEDGEIHDLDNNKRELTESEISVSHPIEWDKYPFLNSLDVSQPFKQVGREVFVATDIEKSYNSCARLKGRVMPAGDFKASLSSHGFKLLNKNRYAESDCAGNIRGNIMCVLEFDPTNFAEPDRLIAMGSVKFYNYADLIKLGGQIYADGVKPYPIQSIPPIIYSEFLRDVFALLKEIK